MKAIWKYEMTGANREFEMPVGAEIIHVDMQAHLTENGDSYLVPTFWAIVNPNADLETRSFQLVGTGVALPGDMGKYHGTVMDGAFVWHVVEILT